LIIQREYVSITKYAIHKCELIWNVILCAARTGQVQAHAHERIGVAVESIADSIDCNVVYTCIRGLGLTVCHCVDPELSTCGAAFPMKSCLKFKIGRFTFREGLPVYRDRYMQMRDHHYDTYPQLYKHYLSTETTATY
jgi:hypothetical protein